MAWCQEEVLKLPLDLIRLDTWAENESLIRYYSKFGFEFIGERRTSTDLALPPQYRGLRLALMEEQLHRRSNRPKQSH
jgi:RimJ/RimL family protein N-acetyltransferase